MDHNIKDNYNDCGVLIFDKKRKILIVVVVAVPAVERFFLGIFSNKLKERKMKKILLIATGALMNSTSSQQGESIPGIAHAISIENL